MGADGGYEPFIAEYYDAVPAYATRRDVPFYVDLARVAGGVLELGCGTGRVLIPTACAGVRVVGLDRSEDMLRKCREKLAQESRDVQERVRLVEGDMVEFDLGETFALVTIPFRPFQHLVTVEEELGCLRCVNRHLVPGGKLVFDVFNPNLRMLTCETPSPEAQDTPMAAMADGRTFRRASRFVAHHHSLQTNDVELIYYVTHPDGRTERLVYAFPFRYFFRYEVEHLLARCGFRVAELCGDYDGSPFGDDSREMIFIAEKTA